MQAEQGNYKKQRHDDRNDSYERSKKSRKDKKHKHGRYGSDSRDRSYDRERRRSDDRSRDHKKKDKSRHDRERDRGDRGDRDRDYRDRHDEKDRRDKDRHDNRDRRDNDRDDRRRSRSYEKDRRDRHRYEKVQKDPYFEERKQIQRLRTSDPVKAEELQKELEKRIILDEKQKQVERIKQKFQQAQKQMQEAKREDHSIIVYCLPLKAKQKHIWKFFYDAGCGKIRDICIIKDARSGKSKGVAYVQFYTSESVEKALLMAEKPFELRGRYFTSLKVQHSQAEKNRAAAAAKKMKLTKPIDPLEQAQQTMKRQMKVFVGGLEGKLADMQESDLKQFFAPFGPINYVDIHRDPQTGRCKGFAYIQYESTEHAKNAVREMNNLEIAGQRISVQTVNTTMKNNLTAGEDYLYSAGSKDALRNKLSRSDAPSHSNLMRPPLSTVSTQYLVLSNLFKMQGTTPKYFEDLKKSILAECSNFGIVEKCFIEKSNQGNVFVKFSDTQSATKAQQKLNGQFFDQVKVFCYAITEQVYTSRVGN